MSKKLCFVAFSAYFNIQFCQSENPQTILATIGVSMSTRLFHPKHLDDNQVILRIDPKKDVDAFHPYNVGKIMIGDYSFLPCTPAGVMALLERSGIDVCGKECVVVGRSNIVGKPQAMLLLHKSGTVTVCHSRSYRHGHFHPFSAQWRKPCVHRNSRDFTRDRRADAVLLGIRQGRADYEKIRIGQRGSVVGVLHLPLQHHHLYRAYRPHHRLHCPL